MTTTDGIAVVSDPEKFDAFMKTVRAAYGEVVKVEVVAPVEKTEPPRPPKPPKALDVSRPAPHREPEKLPKRPAYKPVGPLTGLGWLGDE